MLRSTSLFHCCPAQKAGKQNEKEDMQTTSDATRPLDDVLSPASMSKKSSTPTDVLVLLRFLLSMFLQVLLLFFVLWHFSCPFFLMFNFWAHFLTLMSWSSVSLCQFLFFSAVYSPKQFSFSFYVVLKWRVLIFFVCIRFNF